MLPDHIVYRAEKEIEDQKKQGNDCCFAKAFHEQAQQARNENSAAEINKGLQQGSGCKAWCKIPVQFMQHIEKREQQQE